MAKKEVGPAEEAVKEGRLTFTTDAQGIEWGVLALKKPIVKRTKIAGSDEVNEEPIAEIRVREALAADLRALDDVDGQVAGGFVLISKFSGLPIKTLEQLRASDFGALSEVIGGFTSGGLATGSDA